MSGDSVHANLEVFEDTVATPTTLTLTRRSRKIVILNDHASNDLQYKFNASEDYATLQGTESLSLYFRTNTIFINGTSVPYRIWIFG